MRGFGHVDFETTEGAANAVAMSGQYMDGRELYIEATEGRAPRKFCYNKLDYIMLVWFGSSSEVGVSTSLMILDIDR
jgi:hypothetical protein